MVPIAPSRTITLFLSMSFILVFIVFAFSKTALLVAIYFFNTTTKNVFVWAEKLRVKIARKPISVVSKQTTFTVSIGIASTTNKDNTDEVLHNANLALNKALEKGGNAVLNVN